MNGNPFSQMKVIWTALVLRHGNVDDDGGFSGRGMSVTGDRVGLSANGFTATS